MISIIFSFGLGLIIGSFLNVCISRLPKDESIVFPPSHCPKCSSSIKWYDNIPLISFLILRGKCRNCQQPISFQYPVIELLTGVLTMLFWAHWGDVNPVWAVISLTAVYALIVMSMIDFNTMMISDFFPLVLTVLGLAGSYWNECFYGSWVHRLAQSGLGILAGAGSIWLMAVLGKAIYKKDAVGEGDIFLMGGIGALCGWQGVITSVMMAAFFGTVYGVYMIIRKKAGRTSNMAFGPFLAMGAAINLYTLVKPEYFFFLSPF